MPISIPSNSRGPVLDLALPVQAKAITVIITNQSTSKSLALNLPAAWNGDDLTLDFVNRTIRDQKGADRSGLLDPVNNQLWVPEPLIGGPNVVKIQALAAVESQTKSPGTVVDDATNEGTAPAWATPANAKVADNVRTTCTLPLAGLSHRLKATGYGFALPASVEIKGVVFTPQRGMAVGKTSVKDAEVKLVIGNAVQATNRSSAAYWTEVEEDVAYGGPTDLWGVVGLSKANVEGATFGAALAVANFNGNAGEIARVDAMPITVYYRPIVAYAATATLRWEKGYH
jgi:hypothetical protein